MTVEATPAAGLPIAGQATEPAWVRNGSETTKKDYEIALSFEQALVEQLSKSLTATSGLGGEGGAEGEGGGEEGGSSSAANGELSSMLPQALTSGVMGGGGLGLAAQMTRQQQSLEGVAAERLASGGAPPVAGAPSASQPAAAKPSEGAAITAAGGSEA